MPAGRWCEHLAWAGALTMALVGSVVLMSGDSDASAADPIAPPAVSAGTGRDREAPAPRTLAEAEARHQALRAKCQRLPVAATIAECQRNADRQRALDRARLLPHAGGSAASSTHPP